MNYEESTTTEPTPEGAFAQAPAAPVADTNHRLAAAREFAEQQYDKIRRATAHQVNQVRQYTATARHQINEGWDHTCAKAKDLHKTGENYVRENPTGTVLGALGVGVLLGLILGRR